MSTVPRSIPALASDSGYARLKEHIICVTGLGYYAEFKITPGLLESKNCKLAGIVTGTPAKAAKWKEKCQAF